MQVPQVLACEAVPVSEDFFRKIKLPDGSCAKMTSAAPWIFFVCCDPSHRVICVGASRERLLWWPEFGSLRDEARSDLVGLDAVEQWERRLVALIDLEQRDTNDRQAMTKGRREEIRKAVMSQDWHLLSSRQGRKARSLLANPLRQCQGHLGQAYIDRNSEANAYGIVGCCYLCKMAIGYQEAEVDDLDKAKVISWKSRRKCPHSCAEVAASAWCDQFRASSG